MATNSKSKIPQSRKVDGVKTVQAAAVKSTETASKHISTKSAAGKSSVPVSAKSAVPAPSPEDEEEEGDEVGPEIPGGASVVPSTTSSMAMPDDYKAPNLLVKMSQLPVSLAGATRMAVDPKANMVSKADMAAKTKMLMKKQPRGKLPGGKRKGKKGSKGKKRLVTPSPVIESTIDESKKPPEMSMNVGEKESILEEKGGKGGIKGKRKSDAPKINGVQMKNKRKIRKYICIGVSAIVIFILFLGIILGFALKPEASSTSTSEAAAENSTFN